MSTEPTKTRKFTAMSASDPDRPIVLVGLMGTGKSTVGRRLAARLDLPFVDADAEIEAAAGMSINDIFDQLGEDAFRDGERRVIARLMDAEPKIIATGGGAFVDDETRTLIKEKAVSVWLDADLDVLVERTSRRNTRPLLRDGDPREILTRLAKERQPYYEQADIHVRSGEGPHSQVVEAIVEALDTQIWEVTET